MSSVHIFLAACSRQTQAQGEPIWGVQRRYANADEVIELPSVNHQQGHNQLSKVAVVPVKVNPVLPVCRRIPPGIEQMGVVMPVLFAHKQ